MRPGQVPEVTILNVIVHGTQVCRVLAELLGRLGSGREGAGAGRYFAAWAQEMHPDAVFLHVPRCVIPVIVDATRCVSRQFSISVMVSGGP